MATQKGEACPKSVATAMVTPQCPFRLGEPRSFGKLGAGQAAPKQALPHAEAIWALGTGL